MIRKWLGRLVAAAIVALLVFAVLHRGAYRSLLFDEEPTTVPTERADVRSDAAGDAASPASDGEE